MCVCVCMCVLQWVLHSACCVYITLCVCYTVCVCVLCVTLCVTQCVCVCMCVCVFIFSRSLDIIFTDSSPPAVTRCSPSSDNIIKHATTEKMPFSSLNDWLTDFQVKEKTVFYCNAAAARTSLSTTLGKPSYNQPETWAFTDDVLFRTHDVDVDIALWTLKYRCQGGSRPRPSRIKPQFRKFSLCRAARRIPRETGCFNIKQFRGFMGTGVFLIFLWQVADDRSILKFLWTQKHGTRFSFLYVVLNFLWIDFRLFLCSAVRFQVNNLRHLHTNNCTKFENRQHLHLFVKQFVQGNAHHSKYERILRQIRKPRPFARCGMGICYRPPSLINKKIVKYSKFCPNNRIVNNHRYNNRIGRSLHENDLESVMLLAKLHSGGLKAGELHPGDPGEEVSILYYREQHCTCMQISASSSSERHYKYCGSDNCKAFLLVIMCPFARRYLREVGQENGQFGLDSTFNLNKYNFSAYCVIHIHKVFFRFYL